MIIPLERKQEENFSVPLYVIYFPLLIELWVDIISLINNIQSSRVGYEAVL